MSLEGKPFSPAYGTLEALGRLADIWNAGPPMKHLGARLEFTRIDRVRAVIDPVLPFHRGGMGTDAVNGVVLAGLFDLVIGTVGWLTRPETRSATVNLAMTFFRPTRGSRVAAEARLVRPGMNLIFAAAEITDGAGEVTARCDGTCAVAQGRTDSQEIYEKVRAGKVAP
ncbi:MAG: PaaI family thioesterase [Acidobacteriota bacterium]